MAAGIGKSLLGIKLSCLLLLSSRRMVLFIAIIGPNIVGREAKGDDQRQYQSSCEYITTHIWIMVFYHIDDCDTDGKQTAKEGDHIRSFNDSSAKKNDHLGVSQIQKTDTRQNQIADSKN
jgi:hypothetical protein